MNVIYLERITRKDIKNNPDSLFIFGDNDMRQGFGGQAKEMRGEPNSFGIRVKKSPDMYQNSFYTDNEYNKNITKIKEDIDNIIVQLTHKYNVENHKYNVVVIPSAGIGTGLAQLNVHAPRTAKFLDEYLMANEIVNYKMIKKWRDK